MLILFFGRGALSLPRATVVVDTKCGLDRVLAQWRRGFLHRRRLSDASAHEVPHPEVSIAVHGPLKRTSCCRHSLAMRVLTRPSRRLAATFSSSA
jgi:hypothetical protein